MAPAVAPLALVFAVTFAQHAEEADRRWLAAFTLVRGGSSESAYTSFENSRLCLRKALPAVIAYDDVAFHEGNVPDSIKRALLGRMCAVACAAKTPPGHT
eukprot:7389466-Prymnesium_polylepis.2